MEPLIREIPARWVAAIETELVQEELPDFLESAISGLLLLASAHHAPRPTTSTAEWPAFAIYYGIINSRRPIRVEAALTLPGYLAPEGLIRVREEPQHREAYLPMTREQLLGPEAARIYDTLGGWIAANASGLACQVFVATQDVAFLKGLAEGAPGVTIIRTSRKEDITSFHSIPHDATRALARFPIFATQDALRLLFCDGVVVAADADDRLIYETVANRLPTSNNIGFIHAVDTRNVALVTKVLRQCALPVCSVVELDVLRNEKELSDLIQAASGSPAPQPWLATRERLAKHVEGWFDEKAIAASANEVESFLDQIKGGGTSPPKSQPQRTAVGGVQNWDKLRHEQLEWLPRELRMWIEELLEDLKRFGIFVSPKGRLEGWIETGSRERRVWVNQAIQVLHQGQCPTELQTFVTDLITHLSSTSNSTRSARTGNRT